MSTPEEDEDLEECDDEMLESYLYGECDVVSIFHSDRGPPFRSPFYSVFRSFLTPFHIEGIEEMDPPAESDSDDLTGYRERSSQRPTSDPLPNSFQNHPPEQFYSPSTPTSPTTPQPSEDTSEPQTGRASMSSTSTVSLKNISVKAYLTEDIIIVFRVPIETRFAEIRDKVYDKFVNQEGISLRPDFPLAYLTPARRRSTTSSVYSGIKRSASVGSASAHASSLVQIQSQEDWNDILRESDGKLTLRVFE